MVQKASTPWSTRTVAEGGTDSPVGDLVPIPDKITPVVNTGFISLAGKYRGIPADDLAFTFQDPNQALGAGASIFIDVDMMVHEQLIFGILDSSGNAINIDVTLRNPATAFGPYNNPIFTGTGINGGFTWKVNSVALSASPSEAKFAALLLDSNENLGNTWQFYKIAYLRGLACSIEITSNEGSDAGTISTAYLRLV